MFWIILWGDSSAAFSNCSNSPELSCQPRAPKFSSACFMDLTPGIGMVPLQMHQFIATWQKIFSYIRWKIDSPFQNGLAFRSDRYYKLGDKNNHTCTNIYLETIMTDLCMCVCVHEQVVMVKYWPFQLYSLCTPEHETKLSWKQEKSYAIR